MNKKLYNLYKEDQDDRRLAMANKYDFGDKKWKLIEDRDCIRRKKTKEILKSDVKFSGEDYFHAAMIFQHGQKPTDYKMAAKLAKKAADLGHQNAKWLYAAATDRLLVNLGRKQKYGTQYQKRNDKWILLPVNKRTSDKERVKFNVPSLKEAERIARDMNKRDN